MTEKDKFIEKAKENIEKLKQLKTEIHGTDFLRTWDHTKNDLEAVVYVAQALENMIKANISCQVFKGGLAISNFRDQSTRTRFSYSSAANLVGLANSEIDESKSQVAHGETVRETANMISFFAEFYGIRDDIFLGEGHKFQKEVSDAVADGFKQGVLNSKPPIINLQCDEDHPTQSLSDLIHIAQYFGGLENLKGKKIAMTWAFSPSYGKPLSVPQAIIALMTRFGMDVRLAHPEGYDLIPEIVDLAKKNAEENGGKFTQFNNMEDAFKDADIVYPKSWAPFVVMQERTKLLKQGNAVADQLKQLEKKCIEKNKEFIECDEEKMKLTKDGKALYMHCLPADITGVSCEHGEVSAQVFDKYRIDTYKEAGHKMYVISAMMLLTKFKDVPELLTQLIKENTPRKKAD
ncbi:ornithine carbamoyltransferase [Anaeramoeba ignava]|uniref:ornithine carbamoyltransferase n=1 Tax=Anaeramoeba ignava TaxID=1746090 RepID=A0A9Q0LAA8_ANAIG|nr:ornithine carbamoyltransferase [Anaeramoeba ignava]